MSTETGYQGWKNYETWCVKLWIDNDQGAYEYWRGETRNAWDEAGETEPLYRGQIRHDRARLLLAELLKDYHNDEINFPALGTLGAGPHADLLNAALSEVDWYEIAQSLLDDEDFATTPEAAS